MKKLTLIIFGIILGLSAISQDTISVVSRDSVTIQPQTVFSFSDTLWGQDLLGEIIQSGLHGIEKQINSTYTHRSLSGIDLFLVEKNQTISELDEIAKTNKERYKVPKEIIPVEIDTLQEILINNHRQFLVRELQLKIQFIKSKLESGEYSKEEANSEIDRLQWLIDKYHRYYIQIK